MVWRQLMESLATTILDATYNKVNLDEVISDQKHLTKKTTKGTKESFYQIRKTIQWNTCHVSALKVSHRAVSRRSC